jgi:uncharacterized Tic20 family protein
VSMAMSTPYGPQPGHASARPANNGRLRDESLSTADRNFAIAMHLSPFAVLVTGMLPLLAAPLVLWLVRKDQSVYCDDQGRDILNFWISQTIIFFILLVSVIGWLLVPVQAVVIIVNMIRGAVAAGNAEYFRYPMTFRFLG